MANTQSYTSKFTGPGIYHIKVQGNVRPELWEYFGAETDCITKEEDESVTSELTLGVRDQAELIGMINMLYNWHYILLSVHFEKAFNTSQTN